MKKEKIYPLCESAIAIAVAMVLGYIKIFQLPQGGSITIGMLPIFLYNYKWGIKKSLLASFSYGLLQLVLDGAYAWSPWSMLLDYILAYGLIGISGCFAGKKYGIYLGIISGSCARFLAHFISGITIYRIYFPTELLNLTIANPYVFSFIYSASYIFPSMFLCLMVAFLLKTVMNIYINKQ